MSEKTPGCGSNSEARKRLAEVGSDRPETLREAVEALADEWESMILTGFCDARSCDTLARGNKALYVAGLRALLANHPEVDDANSEAEGLSEAEREALADWWASDWPSDGSHVLDALADVVAGILAARVTAAESEARARGAVEALREFADSRGVNVGDEDDEWWSGYRQAQRECLRDAADRADEYERGERA